MCLSRRWRGGCKRCRSLPSFDFVIKVPTLSPRGNRGGAVLCSLRLGGDGRMWTIAVIVIGAAVLIAGSRFFFKAPAPAPGSAAPEFTLVSQDGSNVSLRDYRG